jgi:hypothetical protein
MIAAALRLRQCPDHRKQLHRASLPRTFYYPYAAYGEANATRRPPVVDRNGRIVKPFEPSTQTTRPGRITKMLLGLQGPWEEATLPLPEHSEQSWKRTLVCR